MIFPVKMQKVGWKFEIHESLRLSMLNESIWPKLNLLSQLTVITDTICHEMESILRQTFR
jgi:hypothetical protein